MGLVETVIDFLGPWNWWVLGLVLLAVEILIPGTFFLWFGVSAIVVGTISLFITWGWQAQVIVFMVLAVVALVASRMLLRRTREPEPAETTFLNRRGARLIGRTFTLTEPIVEGSGRLKIDDSVWRVSGPDLAAGTRVTIVDADGALLRVGPAEVAETA
ncbi:hypothetical protein GGD81_001933 [Rhodobium orientis]|uniref:NfeD-like C-terminal domain-containing protein n=1 Tax=Rhodobium orientis TaxID=34017 RepID=A0A327JJG1_9HYPH|nr:NfeD family protein [Rhodobium orientis]MBB4302895.1 hypothetical protein [Rhodobium orientis]MBK5949456.1 hypothetical protein [Rhodobium orientis]RAI26025.1 hypothetical protein CH339_15850 [Rhodobium orientis]